MSIRDELERRIDRERQKLGDMYIQLERAESFIKGLEEALKFLPRDGADSRGRSGLRLGSDMYQVQEVLRQQKRPMYIVDILKAIGKPTDSHTKASISGSLSRYARRQEDYCQKGCL